MIEVILNLPIRTKMRNLNKLQLSALLLAITLPFYACNNSIAENKGNNKTNAGATIEQNAVSNSVNTSKITGSKLQAELDKAKKTGKAVFMVVTGNGVAGTDKAMTIANGAKAIYKNSEVFQMNRDDVTNARLVTEWRLSGATLPVILVISPKGQATGGYLLAQATAENLASLVPSPKLEEVYAAIASSKPAIVVFTKKTLADRSEVLKIGKDAITKLKNNAVLVEVNMDDSKEANFMKQLRIDKASKASLTIVINTQGQVAGTSATMPDAAKLAAAATQPVKSGCGAGCGPAGCAK